MLVKRNYKVAIADLNLVGAKAVASSLNIDSANSSVFPYMLDAASWDSQASVFQRALDDLGGRIDFVCPIAGIGEKRSIPNDLTAKGFMKPELACLDVDLTGVVYTASLAVQQMRRQEKDEQGFRGKS